MLLFSCFPYALLQPKKVRPFSYPLQIFVFTSTNSFTNILLFVFYITEFHSCVTADDCPYDFCSPPKYAKCVYNSCYCEDQGRL